MPSTPTTVQALETELAAIFAAMALIADQCYGEGAGHRLLELSPDVPGFSYSQVPVRRTRLGEMLPVWYAYAFQGQVLAGYDIRRWDTSDGLLERLGDLLGVFREEDGYVEDCLNGVSDGGSSIGTTGHLAALHARVGARLALDNGESLSLKDLAVLAEMNERSVRNAVHAEGDSRLALEADERVSNAEAARWLAGRRNFFATSWRKLEVALDEQPDSLLAPEIPRYVEQRLRVVADGWGNYLGKGDWEDGMLLEAKRRCGLPLERLKAATCLPLDIRPAECPSLAKLLEVDVVWFTHQVMYALYPEQMDALMNPRNWSAPAPAVTHGDAALKSVTVELTGAMLTHGYLDIPIDAASLFAGADFGSKGTGFEGTQVELRFGGHTAVTDIRMKSTKTLAPRKRFTGWFTSELRAKPGDRIRVDRVSEGVYSLTHLPA